MHKAPKGQGEAGYTAQVRAAPRLRRARDLDARLVAHSFATTTSEARPAYMAGSATVRLVTSQWLPAERDGRERAAGRVAHGDRAGRGARLLDGGVRLQRERAALA